MYLQCPNSECKSLIPIYEEDVYECPVCGEEVYDEEDEDDGSSVIPVSLTMYINSFYI